MVGFAVAVAACAAAPAKQAAPAQVAPPEKPLSISYRQEIALPPMPYACDLEAVPVGAWADYEVKGPGIEARTERKAAVARGPEGITIEMTHRRDFVVAELLAPGKGVEERVRKTTVQDGDYDPMDSSSDRKHQRPYRDLESLTLIGEDEVSVRGGTFHTKRYRYRTDFDEAVEVWVNDTLWPICVVKLDAELKQPWRASGRFNYEVIATGSGATPKITRPAIPFDAEVVKKRNAARMGHPPGTPPPGPAAPSPSPR